MRSFRDRKVNILVCTDVASRGLDVKDLTHVINYSIPREMEVYVHRIGRTARSGRSGVALSLVAPSHRYMINRIEHMTKVKMREGKIPGRREVAQKKVSRLLARFMSQQHHAKAAGLLGAEWGRAAKDMTLEEILGRFIAMTAPELFAEREKTLPAYQSSASKAAHAPHWKKNPHPPAQKRR